jgi:hypothetical protein
MKWYSSLSKILLENIFEQDEHFAELCGLLADRILNLYKTLLKYISRASAYMIGILLSNS